MCAMAAAAGSAHHVCERLFQPCGPAGEGGGRPGKLQRHTMHLALWRRCWPRDGLEMASRWPRDGLEMAPPSPHPPAPSPHPQPHPTFTHLVICERAWHRGLSGASRPGRASVPMHYRAVGRGVRRAGSRECVGGRERCCVARRQQQRTCCPRREHRRCAASPLRASVMCHKHGASGCDAACLCWNLELSHRSHYPLDVNVPQV